jgi:Predicted membrane protein
MLSGKREGRPLRKSIALVLALSGAGTAMLLAPVTVGAATRGVPSASSQHPVIPPAGRVQGTALPLPGPQQSPTESVKSLPFRSINPEALSAAKRTATEALQRAPAGVGIPSFSASPSVAGLFNGLNRPGLSASDESSSVTPPDSTGAIGPTRYVEMVNQLVGVYDRSNLALLSRLDLGTFVGAPGGITTSDPQVEWDAQANRWLYGAVGFDSTFLNNYLLFGWSKTADPSDLTGGWCRFGVFTGSNLQDYPKLGHDANFVTFGSNVFDGSKTGFPFVTANIWAIAKPGAADSTCSSPVSAIYFADATHLLRNADASLASTPVPANTTDAAANGYIVAAHDPSVVSQSKVMVWHMETRPTTPFVALVADGDLLVGGFGVPPPVPQPGTPYLLDSLDGRLTQAVAHWDPSAGAEAVWTQHTVAGSGPSMVRWYEFLPTTMTIRQQGQLASATDFFWNAAISPSSAGSDAAIFYNRGSSSLLPVIGAQTRVSSTPLGQMDAGEVLLGSSTDADQETGFSGNCAPNPCRWGDYSGATPDPVNAGVVWGSNQLTGPVFPFFNLAQWTTQNFAISTGTAAPAGDFSLTATPPSQTVVAGNPAIYTVNITRTGGFAGSVDLSMSGLPAGASGTFTPTPASGTSSSLSVTTATTTPTGSYLFTITGTSVSLTRTTTATLVVTAAPAGNFSLSATPTIRSIKQGRSTTYTITITRTSFTGGVTFSVIGLPAGTTATFSPNPGTGASSTLTVVTARRATPTGTSLLTITGTSGSRTHTTTVTLVVT